MFQITAEMQFMIAAAKINLLFVHSAHLHEILFVGLFQPSKLCCVRNNDQRAFRIKHLLGIDIYVDAFALLNCDNIEAVFFAEIQFNQIFSAPLLLDVDLDH